MNAEHEFLASAYLDGDLTDEERRIAEADPAVMAEVDDLRALRTDLAATPPPSDTARESAIAAAMSEFGQLYGSAAGDTTDATRPATPEQVVPFRPRPAIGRWLSVAAAVLVVGLLGVVVASGLRSGGDDDDSSAADEPIEQATFEAAAEEPAADDGDRMTEDATAVAGEADDAEAELASDMAADEPADEPAEEPAEDVFVEEPAADEPADSGDDMADEPADDADDMTAEDEEPTAAPADPADILDAGVPITTQEELAAVGRLLLERQAEGALTTPEESCPFPNMLARADVVDSLTGEQWPVVIDVDGDNNLVLAIDVDSCEVRLDAALTETP